MKTNKGQDIVKTEFTNEANIILQTFANVELFRLLAQNKFQDSSYFDEISSKWYLRDTFKQIKVDNQGSLLMSLYAMVVVPYELLQSKYSNEFNNLNSFLQDKLEIEIDTYKDGGYLRHIRNAIAHTRIGFEPNEHIVFEDKFDDKRFKVKMKLSDVEEFLNKLRGIYSQYVKDLK